MYCRGLSSGCQLLRHSWTEHVVMKREYNKSDNTITATTTTTTFLPACQVHDAALILMDLCEVQLRMAQEDVALVTPETSSSTMRLWSRLCGRQFIVPGIRYET